MKLYLPVLIESAEQAEALPIGTVATDLGSTIISAAVRTDVGLGWFVSGDEMTDMHEHMVGWTALVPIEAEEETTEQIQVYLGVAHIGPRSVTPAPSRRLVTPWEEAQ